MNEKQVLTARHYASGNQPVENLPGVCRRLQVVRASLSCPELCRMRNHTFEALYGVGASRKTRRRYTPIHRSAGENPVAVRLSPNAVQMIMF